MSDIAIDVENLSKCYRIGLKEQMHETFGGALGAWLKSPFANLKKLKNLTRFKPGEPESDDLVWALKDVSFTVKQGEVIGIIGRNGAGKSTLLKILSRIVEPTSGRALINGRVASLLEVGTGFHQELTGRENIYLNGAVLGMTKKEIDSKFDDIVSFAEIGKFLDTPVKRYSSGMTVRLAFAVAAHLEPEILLVDEVLAVGDAAFQKKCIGKMGDITKQGRTVLFVSHNMGAVRRLCRKCILLSFGTIVKQGDVYAVVDKYENMALTDNSGIWKNEIPEEKEQEARLEQIEVLGSENKPQNVFLNTEPVYIKFLINVRKIDRNLKLGFDLLRNGEIVFRTQQVDSLSGIGPIPIGKIPLICEIPGGLLNAGEYYIVPLCSIHNIKWLYWNPQPVVKFRVEIDARVSSFHTSLTDRNQPGLMFPLLKWDMATGNPEAQKTEYHQQISRTGRTIMDTGR